MSPPKKKPGTATRPAATRSGSRPAAARSGAASGAKAARSAGGGNGGQRPAKRPGPPPIPARNVVVGTIPPLARVAGGAGLLAGVLLLVQPAFPYVQVAGHGLGGAHNLWDFVVPLPAALLLGAAGVLCLLGRLPRLGLAVVIGAGAFELGQLLRTAALLDTGRHYSADLPLPEALVRPFRYDPGPGLVLQVVALAALAAGLLLGLAAWRRTVMEDEGSFDRLRPTFGALAFAGALVGFAAVAFPPSGAQAGGPALVVPSLFERTGLDALGGWLTAVGVAAAAVGAATVRPRLAVVGIFAGLAGAFGTAGLASLLLAIRSTLLDVDAGTGFQLAAAVLFAGLAAAAWWITPKPLADADDD